MYIHADLWFLNTSLYMDPATISHVHSFNDSSLTTSDHERLYMHGFSSLLTVKLLYS